MLTSRMHSMFTVLVIAVAIVREVQHMHIANLATAAPRCTHAHGPEAAITKMDAAVQSASVATGKVGGGKVAVWARGFVRRTGLPKVPTDFGPAYHI